MRNEIKICFIGDSIVNGACDSTQLGWAGRVCADAVQKGVNLTYYNLGVRGNTSHDIVARWLNECTNRLMNCQDARIVLSCGINDTVLVDGKPRLAPDVSCNNIQHILKAAARHHYRLCLVGPPPVHDSAHNTRIAALTTHYSTIANDSNIPFIDIFEPLMASTDYTKDIAVNKDCYPAGYHPTSAGYAMIADIITQSPAWWFHS